MEPAYSKCIISNDTIFTSGQLAIGKDGELVGLNDIKEQTIQTLTNLKSLLAENGFGLENIASVTIFIKDINNDFKGMDLAYRHFLKDMKPARATVEARLFKPEFLIEMTAIASKQVDNKRRE